jgi:hypothetical protein
MARMNRCDAQRRDETRRVRDRDINRESVEHHPGFGGSSMRIQSPRASVRVARLSGARPRHPLWPQILHKHPSLRSWPCTAGASSTRCRCVSIPALRSLLAQTLRARRPRLVTQVTGLTPEIDDSYQFFVGLTLSSEFVYSYDYAAPGLSEFAPPGTTPTVAGLRRVTLTSPAKITESQPRLPFEGATIGLEGLSYDPTDGRLLVSLIPSTTYYPGTSMPRRCATAASSRNACPVERFAPLSFPTVAG